MFKQTLVPMLIWHLLGDYYLQTERIARGKRERIGWLLLHCALYGAAMFGLFASVGTRGSMTAAIALAIAHAAIDTGKFFIQKHFRPDDAKVYLADQALHLLCLIAAAFALCAAGEGFPRMLGGAVERVTGSEGLAGALAAVLIVLKPANIAIRTVLSGMAPQATGDDAGLENAGRLIGDLERLIILIFIASGQYAAIGFVLTAKSVARYDRITRDKAFGEYYLLGTLLSTLIVIATGRLLL